MTPAENLVKDIRAVGYRAFIQRWKGQACIVVEDGNGRQVPTPFCGTISVSYDGQRIGRLVGTGASADDDVHAVGERAIRTTLSL